MAVTVAGAALFVLGCGMRQTRPGPPEPQARAWPVMGTLLQVTVWEPDAARAAAALQRARGAVFRVDTLMSVYRQESELSQVNARAGSGTRTVLSRETSFVLDQALRFARETGGALDVTVGPLVDIWGFYREEGRRPAAPNVDSAARLVGYEKVEFDPVKRTVLLPLPGMRLDFGAIAKGYAVDLAIEALRSAGVERAVVDLGGNLRVLGSPPPGQSGWSFGLRDPRAPEELIALLSSPGGAVATSGDYERFFVLDGVRYSHIFDPRAREPARGVAAASVLAPTALEADALSTALFVLGPLAGCALLAARPGTEAIWFLDRAGTPRIAEGAVGDDDAAWPGPGDIVVSPGFERRLELLVGAAPEAAVACPYPS